MDAASVGRRVPLLCCAPVVVALDSGCASEKSTPVAAAEGKTCPRWIKPRPRLLKQSGA